MPEHDYRQLARTLVRAGCAYISDEHHANGKQAEKLMVQAAITAQRRLVIDPEHAFTMEDFKAVTSEIERFKEELDGVIAREPEFRNDSGYHLRKLRSIIGKSISCAASLCAQDTMPEVVELLRKAWDIAQNAEEEAATLSKFRNQLILGFLAEFKHATRERNN